MPCYRVIFFKNLVNCNGQPFNCVQQVIDIGRAGSRERAVRAAELRYGRRHRVHDWKLHADRLELQVGDIRGAQRL